MTRPYDGYSAYAIAPNGRKTLGDGSSPESAQDAARRRYKAKHGAEPVRVTEPFGWHVGPNVVYVWR